MKVLLEDLRNKGFKLIASWSGCRCYPKKKRLIIKETFPDAIEKFDEDLKKKDEIKIEDIINKLLYTENRKVYVGTFCWICGDYGEWSFWLEKIR